MYRLETIVSRLAGLGTDPSSESEGPHAAVAAILRERPDADGADLFFIRRAEHPKDPWSGHIAFPGGRRDPVDATLLDTAIRETREEVGIDLGRADLVARLPDTPAFIRSRRGGLVVSAFVFAVKRDVVVVPNEEVAETLWVPVGSLGRGEGRGTYAFEWEGKPYDLPCFRLPPANHVLWGLTYKMLETMLEAVRET